MILKFAAGVTLYNPSEKEIEHLKLLDETFEEIFLFDNSEPDYNKPQYTFSSLKFQIISENENKGLSYAFNEIIKKCDKYDFLCLLDQDSIFENDEINKIKDLLSNGDNREFGIVAPFVDYGFANHVPSKTLEKKQKVITSGSFLNLNVVRKEQIHFDENYFIDKFEIDLCQQLVVLGYNIMMYHDSVLHQSIGEKSGHSHPNHNPLRHYYLFRNRFYFNDKWYSGIKKYTLNVLQTSRHLLLIILYEKNKLNKIRMLPRALSDYMKGRMGKINNE